MDQNRFDSIAKRVATSTSRRSLLKAGGAAAVGAIAGLFGNKGSIAATLRGPGVVCRKNGDCVSGICGAPDFSGRRKCECAPNQVICGSKCVDPTTAYQTDKKNCGSCGHRCTGSNVCCQGACVAPAAVCSGVCCTGTQVCFSNSCCQPVTSEVACVSHCGESVSDTCGGLISCPPCCVPESEETTCGSDCGQQLNNCNQTVDCGPCCTAAEGSCTVNSDCCSNVCIDGTCASGPVVNGAPCDDDADCQSNACCGDLCVDPATYQSDTANCGSCGTICPGTTSECSTVTCVAGVCGVDDVESGTPLVAQTSGDCQLAVCNGTGGTTTEADDTDTPPDTSDCVIGICTSGTPSTTNAAARTTCDENGGTLCDGAGNCVECTQDTDCTSERCENDGTCCVADADIVTCDTLCGEQTNNCGQTVQCDPCCVPDSDEVTCAETCGSVENNCGETVECGACCPTGQRPSTVGDYCVPDAATCAIFKTGGNASGTPSGYRNLQECDYSGQTIIGGSAQYVDFTGANFTGTTLTSVVFQFTKLGGANFTNAVLSGTSWFTNICPDGTSQFTAGCCANMNGNNPTSCA